MSGSPFRLLPAVLCLLTTACVQLDYKNFPESWPVVHVSGSGCPRLTGVFDETDLTEKYPVWLHQWLLQVPDGLEAQVQRIEFIGPDAGTLALRLMDADGSELLKHELREGVDYECRGGWLERSKSSSPFAGLVTSKAARLTLNDREDLVVESTETLAGVAIVLPTYQSRNDWHVYRRHGMKSCHLHRCG